MKRTLTLKKDTLTELTSGDLAAVYGAGTHVTCASGETVCGLCAAILPGIGPLPPPPTGPGPFSVIVCETG